MSEVTTITCDQCGYDLTYTGNSVDYRLVVGCQAKTPLYIKDGKSGGAVTDMMIYPPIPRTHHFCGQPCLAKWLEPGFANLLASYDRLGKHRKWLDDGCPRSPSPQKEETGG